MTRKSVRYSLAFGVLLIGIAGYYLSRAEVITFRADNAVKLGRYPHMPAEGADLVHTFRAGERAEIIGCEDIKSDVLVHVRVASGDTGYVGSGKYALERRQASPLTLLTNPGRVTFSCKGMFEARSEYVN